LRAITVTGTNATSATKFDGLDQCSRGSTMMMKEARRPQIGDRVALPSHAGVFIITSVDFLNETVDAEMTTTIGAVEKDVPWAILAFLDSA
jgi:hypothetical protein